MNKRPALLASLSACLLLSLTACGNRSISQAIERSLAPDPNLKDNPIAFGQSSSTTPENSTSVKLPTDFPSEIPLYRPADLQSVESSTASETQQQLTQWATSDPSNLVQSFYEKELNSNRWQIVNQPETENADDTLVARRDNLQVTVSIKPVTNTALPTPSPNQTATLTEFTIRYNRDAGVATVPQASEATPTPVASESATVFNDLDKVPAELRSHIQDLAALGVLSADTGTSKSNSAPGVAFEPNKTITRREFARWLVEANNKIYANSPGKQIRLPSTDVQPAFTDVPPSNADFPAIQGLAEAGLIPSRLSGDTTAVLFRPEAPLTRENLILWKVPLDTRQGLPTASVEAAKQSWGFEDAARIEPRALRAVLADFQNGEQANIRRVFGYTTLFQPKKPVTRAEAAAAIWYFGIQGEGISAKEALAGEQGEQGR